MRKKLWMILTLAIFLLVLAGCSESGPEADSAGGKSAVSPARTSDNEALMLTDKRVAEVKQRLDQYLNRTTNSLRDSVMGHEICTARFRVELGFDLREILDQEFGGEKSDPEVSKRIKPDLARLRNEHVLDVSNYGRAVKTYLSQPVKEYRCSEDFYLENRPGLIQDLMEQIDSAGIKPDEAGVTGAELSALYLKGARDLATSWRQASGENKTTYAYWIKSVLENTSIQAKEIGLTPQERQVIAESNGG